MRSYLSGAIVGAFVGSIMTFLYINNNGEIEDKTKKFKNTSRKLANFVANLGEEMSDNIKR
ncbi:MAG TPA: hypothetical protein VFC73_05755 [Syntrophomonadaceae bacterium]|nr:hypothetical protein [Syntrophomonadaceae bacterium]